MNKRQNVFGYNIKKNLFVFLLLKISTSFAFLSDMINGGNVWSSNEGSLHVKEETLQLSYIAVSGELIISSGAEIFSKSVKTSPTNPNLQICLFLEDFLPH